jgi:DNA-binding transcriptional ArsR family regulator
MGEVRKVSDFFEALSDEKRVQILLFLMADKEKNVSEIHQEIGMTLPAISYQLKVLYLNNIITFEKKGREKYYKICDEHITCIIRDAVTHVEHIIEDKK